MVENFLPEVYNHERILDNQSFEYESNKAFTKEKFESSLTAKQFR